MQTKEKLSEKQAGQILVVDDEPAVCDTIKMVLEHDGHKVQTAKSGREALILLEQGKFDLVTTDFSMPGMKGDELVAAIKKRLPNQPILMISGNGTTAMGADLIINKPFLLEDLRKAVDHFISERPPQ